MTAMTSPTFSDGEDYTIEYPGEEELGAFLDSYTEDFLVCTGVDFKTYRRFEEWRDASGRRYRLFFPEPDRLFITLPTLEHEKAHLVLNARISEEMMDMGLGPLSWVHTGATTRSASNGGAGEGDSCMVPRLEVGGRGWPTLVIESGQSQSLASLQRKMSWWFKESHHEVQIVLLVKLSMNRRQILIEKYTESVSSQTGPVTGPSHDALLSSDTPQPFLRQTIKIVPNSNTNTATYSVIGDALLLEFALLRLRPAVPGDGERDIIITEEYLAAWAVEVMEH